MKNFDALKGVVTLIPRNQFGVCCTICTEPRMRKTNNPFVGRVTKVTSYTNIVLGRSYENSVNNRTPNGVKFVAKKPSGKSWLVYPYFLVSDNDNTINYLRLTPNKNTVIKSIYYIDGVEATEAEAAIIKSFLYDNTYSVKQAMHGVAEEDFVKPFDVNVVNIVFIGQGSISYNRNDNNGEVC